MRQIIFLILCLLTLETYSQNRNATRRTSRTISINDFVGTWKLTKLADIHLTYLPDSVKKEILRFTKDSVFAIAENAEYKGTWKLVGAQAIINIKETKRFNYTWISGDVDSKFFTTKGLGYYKYFVRINKH
jgi:hypothetical protein